MHIDAGQSDHDLILAVCGWGRGGRGGREAGRGGSGGSGGVERSEAGRAAFSLLYERHKAWAMSVALRFEPDPERAADAVQDAFLGLLKRRDAMYPGASFRTILYLPVKHAALRHHQRSSRIGSKHVHTHPDVAVASGGSLLAPTDGAGDGDGTGTGTGTGTDTVRVREAVMRLSEAHREALVLRCVDGLSVAEVAIALDIAQGTVKSRLHHAVRAMRQMLGDG